MHNLLKIPRNSTDRTNQTTAGMLKRPNNQVNKVSWRPTKRLKITRDFTGKLQTATVTVQSPSESVKSLYQHGLKRSFKRQRYLYDSERLTKIPRKSRAISSQHSKSKPDENNPKIMELDKQSIQEENSSSEVIKGLLAEDQFQESADTEVKIMGEKQGCESVLSPDAPMSRVDNQVKVTEDKGDKCDERGDNESVCKKKQKFKDNRSYCGAGKTEFQEEIARKRPSSTEDDPPYLSREKVIFGCSLILVQLSRN